MIFRLKVSNSAAKLSPWQLYMSSKLRSYISYKCTKVQQTSDCIFNTYNSLFQNFQAHYIIFQLKIPLEIKYTVSKYRSKFKNLIKLIV